MSVFHAIFPRLIKYYAKRPNYLLDVYKSTGTDQDVFAVRGQTSAFLVQCSDLSAANPTWNLRSRWEP